MRPGVARRAAGTPGKGAKMNSSLTQRGWSWHQLPRFNSPAERSGSTSASLVTMRSNCGPRISWKKRWRPRRTYGHEGERLKHCRNT